MDPIAAPENFPAPDKLRDLDEAIQAVVSVAEVIMTKEVPVPLIRTGTVLANDVVVPSTVFQGSLSAGAAHGEVLLPGHSVVGSCEVGLLAASGLMTVDVFRRPKVCVVTIDDRSWTAANRPQLLALFTSHGCKAIDGGDASLDGVSAALRLAFKFANVLVVAGDVRVVREALIKDFDFNMVFEGVSMLPCLATAFATGFFAGPDRKYVFCLPSNPQETWVAALLLVVPGLRKMSGRSDCRFTQIRVRLKHAVSLRAMPSYAAGRLLAGTTATADDDDGAPWAELAPLQMNLLIHLPPGSSLPASSVVPAFVVAPL